MKVKFNILLFIVVLFLFFTGFLYAEENIEINITNENKIKKITTIIRWAAVDGVIGYRIEISGKKDNIILKENSNIPELKITLPEGKYRIRIGSINKFNKLHSWSDWADLNISSEIIAVAKKGKVIDKTGEEKPVFKEHSQIGIKIAAGSGYSQLMPQWNDIFENSFSGAFFIAGFDLSSIKGINNFFLKRAGVELENSYYVFKSTKQKNRINSKLTVIQSGLNFILSTGFDFLINGRIKTGIGFSQSILDYEVYDVSGVYQGEAVSKSGDFYYKAGISLEIRIDKYFYSEIGVDFYHILCNNSTMKSMRYYFMFGFIF